MRPLLLLDNKNKVLCPYCKIEDPAGLKRHSKKELIVHFRIKHSVEGRYRLIFRSKYHSERKRYLVFSIEGPCACGCGTILKYPTRTSKKQRIHTQWIPSTIPPLFKSGHRSKVQSNRGMFKKGMTPWNFGTKGLMKANSGSFKKGQVPHTYRGGKWTPQGYNYILSDERHPCGARKYIGVARKTASEKIGRPLASNEAVIHIDGNPSNDNPDNLEVITRAELLVRNRPLVIKTKTPIKNKVMKKVKVKAKKKIKKAAKKIKPKPSKKISKRRKRSKKKKKTTPRPLPKKIRPAPLIDQTPICRHCGVLKPSPKLPCPKCSNTLRRAALKI